MTWEPKSAVMGSTPERAMAAPTKIALVITTEKPRRRWPSPSSERCQLRVSATT